MTTHLLTSTSAETVGTSPKAVAATAVSTVLGVLFAVLTAVAGSPELLGGLHPTLQFLILAGLPPVLVGIATYRAEVGKVALPASSAVQVVDGRVDGEV